MSLQRSSIVSRFNRPIAYPLLKKDKLKSWERIKDSDNQGIPEAVADPGVVPRVPGHHPKIQGYTTKLLTSHRSSQLLQESLHTSWLQYAIGKDRF